MGEDDETGVKVTEPARLEPGGAGRVERETKDGRGFRAAAAKENTHT